MRRDEKKERKQRNMNKEHCYTWNIKCDLAPKPHIDKDAIPSCIFDNTVYCNEQVIKARHRVIRERLAEDVVWDATTPLKGWKKHKAFIKRVFDGRDQT